jgi:16S rRNA (adenine1518-N6/adenine1519-N6)-dimethyltransferase
MNDNNSESSIDKFNIKAKKSLGQNFLQSTAALKKIVEAGDLSAEDLVLEIGPGKGALTEHLLNVGASVVAIEKDSDMIEILQKKFSGAVENGKLKLIKGDVLDLQPEEVLGGQKYKLIANIPYYITGEIIRKFLSNVPVSEQPEKIVLLVQKEVADRIMTRDGKESLLSISVKAYCTPRYITKVSAGSFVPAPKVDSAVIAFEHINKNLFNTSDSDVAGEISEELFFEVLHAGFAHKRKRLFSNLKKYFKKIDREFDEDKTIKETSFNKNIRAEELSVEDWIKIIKTL